MLDINTSVTVTRLLWYLVLTEEEGPLLPLLIPFPLKPLFPLIGSSYSSPQTDATPLKMNFRTTTNGRAGGVLARTGSLSGHPSKQQPRSTLLDLENQCSSSVLGIGKSEQRKETEYDTDEPPAKLMNMEMENRERKIYSSNKL
ncbi:hypothetical protein J6590_065955 [Homalodisca vitripennis]|nr:hypothetical protein J6590_097417 [Homalodisca vitripennis]KAG8330359.1 hypothetical protein J6590_065955 [Homalodisca vitripennis]